MKQQRRKALINVSLAVLLVVVCLLSLPAPGMAHVIGGNSWSAQLPVEEKAEVTSDLLTKDGQNIVLSLLEGSRDVEVTIDMPEDVFWYVTATTTSENLGSWTSEEATVDWTYLTLDGVKNSYFNRGGGKQKITLSLTSYLSPIYVSEGEEAPAVEAVTADVDLTLHYITAAEAEALQQAAMETTAEEPLEGAQTTEEMQDTEETAVLQTISATFHVPLRESNPARMVTGQLEQCPKQYHPLVAIPLVNGDADSELKLLNDDFPAMTRYIMGGETYLLYDGGIINVPANESILLDFSLVEELPGNDDTSVEEPTATATDIIEAAAEEPVAEESSEQVTEEAAEETETTEETTQETQEQVLILLAGGREYSLTYAEAPVLDNAQVPFITTGTRLVLPMTYLWNDIAPTVSVEVLRDDGEILVWEVMEDSRWKGAAEGTLLKLSAIDGAVEAGTYRLTITWTENEMTLYSLQTVFYVRSENL